MKANNLVPKKHRNARPEKTNNINIYKNAVTMKYNKEHKIMQIGQALASQMLFSDPLKKCSHSHQKELQIDIIIIIFAEVNSCKLVLPHQVKFNESNILELSVLETCKNNNKESGNPYAQLRASMANTFEPCMVSCKN